MEAAFEAVMISARRDVVGTKIVIGRVLHTPWKRLLAEDPERRSKAWLSYLRNDCLYRMAHTPAGQRALILVDKIAVDRVDESAH